MRHSELLDTRECGRIDRPLIQPEPFAPDVKLVIRAMAAVYRWLDVELRMGDLDAFISFEKAIVSFPEPYSDNGTLTGDCRQWIIEMVSDAVEACSLSMAVVFAADDAVYIWPRKRPIEFDEPPSGGLLI